VAVARYRRLSVPMRNLVAISTGRHPFEATMSDMSARQV